MVSVHDDDDDGASASASLVGRLTRVKLVTGEERLGVVVAVDPVSRGLVLAADGGGGEAPGLVVVMGHAIEAATPLPPRDDAAVARVMEWASRTAAVGAAAAGGSDGGRSAEGGAGRAGVTDTAAAASPSSPPEVTRFAPSPSGHLHLGHAFSALYAARAANAGSALASAPAAAGERGVMIVRIENLDADRCKEEYEASIIEDMDWLGIPYARPVLRQSDRMDAYRAALDRLQSLGVLYRCFCSRKDVASILNAPHGPDGVLYPGTCRELSREEARAKEAEKKTYALRINIERAFAITGDLAFDELGTPPEGMPGGRGIGVTLESVSRLVGDAVLARKDGSPAYHLSVVVDDAHQGVTRVTRGSDLYHATHLHRLLQALLGLPAPRYDHHGIVNDDRTGMRLAKRDNSTTLRDIRAAGATPEEVIGRLRVGVES